MNNQNNNDYTNPTRLNWILDNIRGPFDNQKIQYL